MITQLISLLGILLSVLLILWIKVKAQFGVIKNTATNRSYCVIYYTLKKQERKLFYLFYIQH